MLQAMKQKTTPAAVVVKSSPRDSPSGPAIGKHPWSFPGSRLGSIPCLAQCGGHGFALWGNTDPGRQPTLLFLCPKSHWCRRSRWIWINLWASLSPCRRCRRRWSLAG